MVVSEGKLCSAGLSEYTRMDIRDNTMYFILTMPHELQNYNGYHLIYR